MLRRSFVILLLVSGCAPFQRLLARGDESDRLAAGVTIMRDEWGVPHIFGETDAHAAFGAGYAQAEDGFARLEDAYLSALGRAAHWYGDRYLAADLLASAFELERLAREEYQREPAERRAIWDAFVAGINYWIRTSGERPRLITRFEPWMPFALARLPEARAVIDGVPLDTIVLLAGPRETRTISRDTITHGSTALALAPGRTAQGHALLLHVGRGGFFDSAAPYELMLSSASGWQVRGFARLGMPLPHAGHNGSIAWAQTEAEEDVADVYRLVFDDPADPLAYSARGARQTAREWQDTLMVNSTTGVRPLVVTLRSTPHGPVIARGDTALALRIAQIGDGGTLQQLHAMSRAATLDEFRTALAMPAMPASTVYADTAGNILLVRGGSVPARALNPSAGSVTAGRTAAARTLLESDTTWTFDAWSSLAFNAQLDAEPAIATLASQWERIGGTDPARARRMDVVIDLLRSWDGIATVDSEEAALYILWQERVREAGYVDEYAGFRAMEDVLARLAAAADDGAVQWGDVNRLQRIRPRERFSDDHASLPVGGAPWWTGALFELTAEPGPGALRRYGVAGVTSVLAIELASAVRSGSIVTFGQSADSVSAHWLDQAALYVRGELKPGTLAAQAVRAGARRVYHPGER